jgi:hypothetical protein
MLADAVPLSRTQAESNMRLDSGGRFLLPIAASMYTGSGGSRHFGVLPAALPFGGKLGSLQEMKPLTTSVYTFSNLIEGDFLYVDKTARIYELLAATSAQYFLSRPRRFGKSLLISTLKAIFQGRRELFQRLWLDQSDYKWDKYPVIHLDMGSSVADTADGMERNLTYLLEDQAKANAVSLSRTGCAGQFKELVSILYARDGKVVILVDEYDKPLLGKLGSPDVRDIQALLKTFYGVIKTTEAAQRFVLITGVSKFTKVSIFSDLNNLTDLTMDPRTATLLGYTQQELENNFPDYIERLAGAIGKSRGETLNSLREWYNGYRFHHRAETVYNPVSVMKCFDTQEFRNYWFETGTPTFLVDLLRETPIDLGNLHVPDAAFSTYDPVQLDPLPLLVQTGYLTIKSADDTFGTPIFELDYPNREIEDSLSYWLVRGFSHVPADDMSSTLRRLTTALRENRVADMLENLKVFFAKVPNTITIENEKYYQTIFYTVFTVIGTMIDVEVSTNIGRIDAVLKTTNDIYVLEFKLNGTANEAIEQIHDKRYFEPYLKDGRKITLIGIAFSAKTRNLAEHRIEVLQNTLVRESNADVYTSDACTPEEKARQMAAKGLPACIIKDVTGVTIFM